MLYFGGVEPATKCKTKNAWSHTNALKININCRLIRHYSRFFHAHGQRDVFSLGSASGGMASVCDGFDLLSA